jgi:hypothetical protein
MTSIDWSRLTHAYGPATNTSSLLARAGSASAPREHTDEPWYSLWSSLYHQGDIYDASYAALPALVDLALRRNNDVGIEAMLLAASIELRRNEANAPPLPDDIAPGYLNALTVARGLAPSLSGSRSDAAECAEIVQAVFQGEYARARKLFDEDGPEA